MSARMIATLLLVITAVVTLTSAKNKKQSTLPDYVLRAESVIVMIAPGAGEPLTNPSANRIAQDNVEKALTDWGRLRLVMDPYRADLVIAVRKGHANGPTINNSPLDNRPVIIQPGDSGVRIGGQQGRPPGMGGPPDTGPRIGNEAGSSDDSFEVYRGGVEQPLDSAPVWRFMAKGALDSPRVIAVEQFKKAITESEKQRQQKP